MSIVQMGLREILRRKTTFVLATIAVAVAVGTMLSVNASLEAYIIRSDDLLARKEVELKERLKVLQDEMRKATLKLSFNASGFHFRPFCLLGHTARPFLAPCHNRRPSRKYGETRHISGK